MECNTYTEDQEDNIFYFESDHLALRGHRDYMKLIRTIAVLESQRTHAHRDLENLLEARKRYVNDPQLCLTKLRNNEPLVAPHYFATAKIPVISGYPLMPPDYVRIKKEPYAMPLQCLPEDIKSETYNRLWSCEEQRRLEELLIVYPAEPFESRRFAKIARALGNRTPQQVSSRVQKYFQKLYEAGMPIPGRVPKKRRLGMSRTRNLYRPSTFFPAHAVSMPILEDEAMSTASDVGSPTATALESFEPQGGDSDVGSSHGSDSSSRIRKHAKAQMIAILRAIRDEKQSGLEGLLTDPMAPRCRDCGVRKVSRCAWLCKTCQIFLSYCTDCLTTRLLQNRFIHINHVVEATELP